MKTDELIPENAVALHAAPGCRAGGQPAVVRIPDDLVRLSERSRVRARLRALGFTGDLLSIFVGYAAGGWAWLGNPLHDQVFNMLVLTVPIYLAVGLSSRCFQISEMVRARAAGRAARTFLITLAVVGMIVFFLKVGTDLSRAVFGVGAVVTLIMILLNRHLIARLGHRLLGDTPLNEVLIEDGARVAPKRGAIVISAERYGLIPRLDDPVMLDRLGRCLESADRVIVACPPEKRALWAMALKGADVNGEVLATELDELGAFGIADYGGFRTLIIASDALGKVDRILKRLLDLSLVLLSAPVTLPLMALVALAIKLDSRGSVLFVQERVGLGNRLFRVYKFRSMRVERLDAAGLRSTRRGDDRVTRVGRFIRKTSLDELPQLFNVLRGSMSIVGPRPHALGSRAEDKLFWDINAGYWHRHAVKPGLTGLAQVRGFRGATERLSDLDNRLQSDLEYLSGWSIWRDMAILFATIRVLVHRNAF